jgi:ECF transporter S component (folate family)
MSQNLLAKIMFDKSFNFAYIFKSIVSRWYLYVFLAVVVVGVIVFALIKKPKRTPNLSKTQKLAYISMFVALCVVANIFQIPFPLVQVSFVATIACLAGVLLGPIEGFSIAFIGDLIAGIIAPTGVYSPIIGVGTALFGLVPGLMFYYSKRGDVFNGIISFIITFILTSVIINTIGLTLIYSSGVLIEKIALLPLNLLFHAVNCALSIILIKTFRRILPKDKFNL